MPLPTLQRTWLYKVNQVVFDTGSSYHNRYGTARKIIDGLTTASGWVDKNGTPTVHTNPWVVVGSSRQGGASNWTGTNLWDGTVLPLGLGTWIVLRQPALNNLEYSWHIRYDSGDLNAQGFGFGGGQVAPSGGMTPGTNTSLPGLPANWYQLWGNTGGANLAWLTDHTPGNNTTYKTNLMMSSDGLATRIMVFYGGTCVGFFGFERAVAVDPNWAVNPSVFYWSSVGNSAAGNANTYSIFHGGAKIVSLTSIGFAGFYMTTEHRAGTPLGQAFTVSDLTGEYPLVPVGLASGTVGTRGRLGALADIWLGANTLNNGDGYPADGSKQFVHVGNMILPWNGTELQTS